MMSTPLGAFLIDSSAWIPTLRNVPRDAEPAPVCLRVRQLVAANLAATTGIVRVELLRGARDVQNHDELRHVLLGLEQLECDETAWDAASRLGYRLKAAGLNVQITDLLIAAVALRHGVRLLHRDADFELIAQHTDLKTESHL